MAAVALGDDKAAVGELAQVDAGGGRRDPSLRGEHARGQLAAVGERLQDAGAPRVADEGADASQIRVALHGVEGSSATLRRETKLR